MRPYRVAIIEWDKAASLYRAGAPTTSVASYLGVSEDTLYRRAPKELSMNLATFAAQNRARGNCSLLLKMFEIAVQGGNVDLLKFLAKNRLGYSDRQETKVVAVTQHEIELRVCPPE